MTTQIRDVLDNALPTAPPSTVDISRVMTRARRSARLRTAAVGGGGAAVAAAVTAVALVVGGIGTNGGQLGSPPIASPAVSRTPAAPLTEPAAAAQTRLDAAVVAALHTIAPGFEVSAEGPGLNPAMLDYSPTVVYRGVFTVRSGDDLADMHVYVYTNSPDLSCEVYEVGGASPIGDDCVLGYQGDSTMRSRATGSGDGYWWDVEHPDGWFVHVDLSFYGYESNGSLAPAHWQVLSPTQLRTLALDPTLSLTP